MKSDITSMKYQSTGSSYLPWTEVSPGIPGFQFKNTVGEFGV